MSKYEVRSMKYDIRSRKCEVRSVKSKYKRVSFLRTSNLELRTSQIIHSGVTYIELLIVIAIVAILGAAISPFFFRFILQNNLQATVDRVISTIRKAQNYAMDGKNNEVWGVCETGGKIRLFSGSCSTPSFSEDFDIPGNIPITGFTETTFSKLRGEPSGVLNITISTDIDTRVVNVNAAGGMEIN